MVIFDGNQNKLPDSLQIWLEAHGEIVKYYPNHYLLILPGKGRQAILASGKTWQDLSLQLQELSKHSEKNFPSESLSQEIFILRTSDLSGLDLGDGLSYLTTMNGHHRGMT